MHRNIEVAAVDTVAADMAAAESTAAEVALGIFLDKKTVSLAVCKLACCSWCDFLV